MSDDRGTVKIAKDIYVIRGTKIVSENIEFTEDDDFMCTKERENMLKELEYKSVSESSEGSGTSESGVFGVSDYYESFNEAGRKLKEGTDGSGTKKYTSMSISTPSSYKSKQPIKVKSKISKNNNTDKIKENKSSYADTIKLHKKVQKTSFGKCGFIGVNSK